jgi:hypothetical protein
MDSDLATGIAAVIGGIATSPYGLSETTLVTRWSSRRSPPSG